MPQSTQIQHYDHAPIIDRKPLAFPNNARIAVVVYLNIEHFPADRHGPPIVAQTMQFKPDPLNYGWRDYGQRVGIWRLMELFDQLSIPATVCLNSDVCHEYPRIIEEGRKRNWEWMGHGRHNSEVLNGLSEEDEAKLIDEVVTTIEAATGTPPRGWLGPFITANDSTTDALAKAGIEYICDYSCDDLPFEMNCNTGSLLSMPYSVECNDLPTLLSFGVTAEAFGQLIRDQFDVLYEEGQRMPRVMPICLHTFIVGQPFRAKHLATALNYIASHDDVWFTTAGEINDLYRAQAGA